MHGNEVRLGICFFDNQLLFAVGHPSQKSRIEHIGAIDFNFDLSTALLNGNKSCINNVRQALTQLKKRFSFSHLHVLLTPQSECRTILPKLVYDDAEEREAHINILMNGVSRKNIHTSWHSLSKEKYKLIVLQKDRIRRAVKDIADGQSNIAFASTFEIGERWINHTHPGGSFLTVCCYKNCISLSSFILGKLRGTTYISFDHLEDLPYLWLQHSQSHKWLKGLHEQIQLYGYKTNDVTEILKPFMESTGSMLKMNSLEKMKVVAPEKTYSFNLERAYPSIMMALQK